MNDSDRATTWLVVISLAVGIIVGGLVGSGPYVLARTSIVAVTCKGADISWLDGKSQVAAVVICPDGSAKYIGVVER